MLTFTFLGTSSGVPTKTRNVSGLALQTSLSKKWFLIDAGEATQHRLQHTGLSPHDMAVVCITHAHGDHCYGLPGLLASASMGKHTEPLILIAPQHVLDWFSATVKLTDLHLSYEVILRDSRSLLEQPVELMDGIWVQAYALVHRVECYAYAFTVQHHRRKLNTTALQQLGLPAGRDWKALQHGQDVEFNGQILHSHDFVQNQTTQVKAVIAGDNAQPDVLTQACQNADVLVHEATYLQAVLDKVGPGPMHSSAKLVAEFAGLVSFPNLVLTHFSPRHHGEAEQAKILQEVKDHYRSTVFLADDFKRYRLSDTGVLQEVAESAEQKKA
ncbi:ribonuclease Z [Alkanindiges illinoisensis]|uniref:Ribonuclease Z n=1 Tax=Alkanindiges illinoisensis TaxID=197183 RepID=A0A4Y7XE40_9GAMM|nr:ribonuclease Z [Alkanindiges illinoisensis]TEU29430.1 MBL fold metallo-hydrolase [Alkanindiges illinoisensis]